MGKGILRGNTESLLKCKPKVLVSGRDRGLAPLGFLGPTLLVISLRLGKDEIIDCLVLILYSGSVSLWSGPLHTNQLLKSVLYA